MSSYDKSDPIHNERIDKEIAQDVAVGESVRADQANQRANTYARGYAAKSLEASEARAHRDAAIVNSTIASQQARNASFGFWLLMGIMVVALAIGGLLYRNRPVPPMATTTVVSREMPAAPRRNVVATPAPVTRTVVTTVPVPVPVPATPAPRIINRTVFVPVPVPVAPASSATTRSAEPHPAASVDSDTAPVDGSTYVDTTAPTSGSSR